MVSKTKINHITKKDQFSITMHNKYVVPPNLDITIKCGTQQKLKPAEFYSVAQPPGRNHLLTTKYTMTYPNTDNF